MISGFNTDIKVGETVYHVQTEDKGVKSRLLLSLVYDKGTILASKRVTYDEILKGEFDEKKLAEYLNRQHQVICAAVSAGRIEDLKKMASKARAPQTVEAPAPDAVVTPASAAASNEAAAPPPPIPQPELPPSAHELTDIIIDAVEVIEEPLLEAEFVEVVSELSGQLRAGHNKLTVELLGETRFRGGDRKTINIMVCRGSDRKVVPSAEIMVKVLGSSFRPVIFHARSDANGLAKVHLQLPKFEAGRAALLLRVIAGGEEVELRKIVTPG